MGSPREKKMAASGYEPIPSGSQRVAPGQLLVDVNGARGSSGRRNRSVALLACCGAAALIALLGLAGRAPEERHISLSEKIAKMAVSAHGPQPTQMEAAPKQSTNLAASAHTFAETASGIM